MFTNPSELDLRLSTEIERDSYILVDSLRVFEDLLRSASTTKKMSFDYETSAIVNERYLRIKDEKRRPLDLPRSTITSCSFRFSDGKCYYLSVDHQNSFNMPKEAIIDVLKAKPFSAPICAHNMGFEWLITKNCLNVDLRDFGPLRDTMVQANLLNSNQPVGLKDLTRRYLKVIQESYSSVTDGLMMNQLNARQVLHYGCDDSEFQWQLEEIFDVQLKAIGLWDYYIDLEMPLVPIIAENTLDGCYVNPEVLEKKTGEHLVKMSELAVKIYDLLGKEFNLASYTQVSNILYNELSIDRPPYAESATATDKESIYWNITKHPFMPLLLEWKKYDTRYKLYDKPYANLIHPDTNMVHAQIRQCKTDTGRFSDSAPNRQQLAKRGDGVEVRELFEAPEHLGYSHILTNDMSQVELVLAAHRSKDANLMAEYGTVRGDVHTKTVCHVFGLTREEAKTNKTFRQAGKTANFTLLYNGQDKRLYRLIRLELAKMGLPCPFTLRDASEIRRKWFQLYPGIEEMQKADIKFARANGYVKSLFGRRFYLPDITARNSFHRSKAENKASNSPIQGTCAELMKMAMVKIYDERVPKEDLRMFASVHDELAYYTSNKALRDVYHMINGHMAWTPPGLRAVMAAEGKAGPNFGQMVDIDKYLERCGL